MSKQERIGKPLSFDVSEYRYIQPYIETNGPDETGTMRSVNFSFHVDPALAKKLSQIVTWGRAGEEGIPYRDASELCRDAVAKWVMAIYSYIMDGGDREAQQWQWTVRDKIQRAKDQEDRRIHQHWLEHGLLDQLRKTLYWQEYEAVHSALSWAVTNIQDGLSNAIGRAYARRWIPEMLREDIVKAAIRTLQELPEYRDSKTVLQLGQWQDEYKDVIE